MNDILVIPDVHGRTFWKEAVAKYPGIDTIFLGDYVDPYPREEIRNFDVIINLQEIINYASEHPEVTLLLGNHDLHYLCNFGESCRLDQDNRYTIRQMLSENLHLFSIATVRHVNGKNVVFSHAPILTWWIEAVGETTDLEKLVANLNARLATILDEPEDVARYLGHISRQRGGWLTYGSPVWADVLDTNDFNLIPTADYSIFGHTQLRSDPIVRSRFACLDCRRAFRLTPTLHIEEL